MSQQFAALNNAAQLGAFGKNTTPEPTLKQLAAGNYKKGNFTLHGLNIAIENPAFSYRNGQDENGQKWSCLMQAAYGYIKGVKGNDGDEIDVFIGHVPEQETAYIINQKKQGGYFDEHKIMLGFLSQQQAVDTYQHCFERGWTGLMSVVPCTIEQLKWWLANGDKSRPVVSERLPYAGLERLDSVVWANDELLSHGGKAHNVIYQIRQSDPLNQALEPMLFTDMLCELANQGFVYESYDALVVEYNKLERKAQQLLMVMQSANTTVKPVRVVVGKPLTKNGVANVIAWFEMDDGQAVGVFFHNPDKTPKKLDPKDEMISYKWVLNKKDITIAVAPESGKDLVIRTVAKRIMQLVDKNAPRFAKANSDKSELNTKEQDLTAQVAQKQAALEALEGEIKVLEGQLANKKAAADSQVENNQENQEVAQTEQGATDEGDNSSIISTWDSQAAHAKLKAILADNPNVTQAYNQYFKDNLQGKSVMTAIGKVWITGESRTEMRNRLDAFKLKVVPYVPEILINGKIGKEKANKDAHEDKKSKYISFIPFQHTVNIDGLDVLAMVQVGKLKNDGRLAYSLNVNQEQEVFDGLDAKATLSPSQVENTQGYRAVENSFNSSMVGNSDGEINIKIVKITDRATGKELTEEEALKVLEALGGEFHRRNTTSLGSTRKFLTTPIAYNRKIVIPKYMVTGDDPKHFIENGQTHFENFRISIADDGYGPYAFTEYKDSQGEWLALKTEALETRVFSQVYNKGAEVFEDYKASQQQNQGDLLAETSEGEPNPSATVALTGKELGDFPDTPEGKSANNITEPEEIGEADSQSVSDKLMLRKALETRALGDSKKQKVFAFYYDDTDFVLQEERNKWVLMVRATRMTTEVKKPYGEEVVRSDNSKIFDTKAEAETWAIENGYIVLNAEIAYKKDGTQFVKVSETQPQATKDSPDRDYLQAIIDGSMIPKSSDMDTVIALAEKYEDDEDMMPFLAQALDKINETQQAAVKEVM